MESALWYLQGNFSLFSFPPPPFPSSDSSVVDVRGSSNYLGEFVNFSSFLSQIDSKGGGEKREKRGEATDVVERKGWKEGTKLINTIEEEYERREARAAQ